MVKVALWLLLLILPVAAQWNEEDKQVCDKVLNWTVKPDKLSGSVGSLLALVGRSFLGTEYVAHTLETEGEETLVVNLRGLDCTTFLENALVFARLIKQGKTEFDDYLQELQFVRYRGGVLNGYPSRLHYFSDWIYDNGKKGVIKDVTKDIGGKRLKVFVNFMTAKPKLYPRLHRNAGDVQLMKAFEKEINDREYYFIPKSEIGLRESAIEEGDLIAITSGIEGLDINHVGIAVKKEKRIHFMHAPIVGQNVQITKEPLAEYIASAGKHTGIMVLRPIYQEK